MSEQQDGFEIRGVFYPWVKAIRPIDQPLVVDVTGMGFNEFLRAWQENIEKVADAEEHDEEVDPFDLNPIVMNGLVAAAIWQQHPDWTRQKAFRFFAGLDQDDIEMIDQDESEEDRETDPLSVSGSGSSGSGSSSTTPSGSNGSQQSPPEKTPPSTGHLTSATSSLGSLPPV